MIDNNYYKVNVKYLQHTQLLVAAKDPEAAIEIVKENVLPTTEGFEILGVEALSEEEQKEVIASLMGLSEDVEPSGEVQDTRTLN